MRGDRVEAATEAAEQGAARAEVRRGAGRENPEEEEAAAGRTLEALGAAEVRVAGAEVIRNSRRGSDYKAMLILPRTEFEHAPHP